MEDIRNRDFGIHDKNELQGVTFPNGDSAISRKPFFRTKVSTWKRKLTRTKRTSKPESSAIPSSASPNAENPWSRKTLLTLDGGGVRGYSSLLILKALMTEIATLEQKNNPEALNSVHPLTPCLRRSVQLLQPPTGSKRINVPQKRIGIQENLQQDLVSPSNQPSSDYLAAHYFDYIAGTSTGGLIAVMLGRLHMTVDECLEAYEILGDKVFGHPRKLHIRKPPWIPRDKYDHFRLEEIIKEVVRQRDPWGEDKTMFRQHRDDMTRTILIAWQKHTSGTRVPYLFRSYRHPKSRNLDPLERNPDGPENYKIWEVLRATSAAPFYFKAMKLGDDREDCEYIDGGFGANNPSEEAYASVKQLSNNDPQAVQILVSVGTGKNDESGRIPKGGYKQYIAYANLAAKWATQSEATHETVSRATRGNADYFRLNVEHGIGTMKLDEWKGKGGAKTLHLLRTETNKYLQSDEGRRLISTTAEHLVNVRRARSSQTHLDKWERFCQGVEYRCPVQTCRHSDETWQRHHLCQHLQNIYPSHNTAKIGDLLDEGRDYPAETTP